MAATLLAHARADDFIPRNTQVGDQQPLSPAEAVRHLTVPEGFRVTLAAAEPDVRQPIAIAFDDRGRLWVAESYSYDGSTFTDEPHDRILILEDTTGDGVLDKRKVFCSGLTHLTGLEIGFGGVWITAPPHLSFIPDRQRDDVPDGAPIAILDGWSLKAEHNSVNGLMWGPDGWLYGRHGIKQPSRVGRPGDDADRRTDISCAIWRYHPTRHEFEVVADGTINPWGLDFDDYGQGFLTTSVVEHLWHLVPGAHYDRWKDRRVHPNPYVYETMSATSDHLHWSNDFQNKFVSGASAGKLDFGGGHSHCDAMIYLGGRWPDTFRGSLLMSNIHGRRINRDRLVRESGRYRAAHADDFLISTDPWFRAVSMEYGPDGNVYVTDWSDNGECHDRDGIHRTSGRIYKITWGESIDPHVDLGAASTEQLVEYQLHRNDWFVRHARRLMQERAAAGQEMSQANAKLRRIYEYDADVRRKLRALWALHSNGVLTPAWLRDQLDHESEHIRGWAIRLLADEHALTAITASAFTELVGHEESWLVRMALASALRRLPLSNRWGIALRLGADSPAQSDLNLLRMVWYGIEPGVARNPGRAMQVVDTVAPQLRRWMARRVSDESDRGAAELFRALDRNSRPKVLSDLLTGFNASQSPGPNGITVEPADGTVSKLIGHSDALVRVAAVTTAAIVGGETTLLKIRNLLHDQNLDLEIRAAALQGLARRRPPGLAADLRRLILTGTLTTQALIVGQEVDSAELTATVLDRYKSLDAVERRSAIDLLLVRRSSASALMRACEENEISARDLTAAQARQVAALNDHELLERLERVWGSVRPSSATRRQQIRDWERKLDPSRIAAADLGNGRRLFARVCGSCHQLFGEGRSLGPDLTGANRRNLHYLVSNVIDPSATVPTDFRLATVSTTDGRVLTGLISLNTTETLALQTATEEIQLRKEEVETLTVSTKSMMPDGLLDPLNDAEIRDLFAYMNSTSGSRR